MTKAESLPPVDDVVDRLDRRAGRRDWTPPPIRLRDVAGLAYMFTRYGLALYAVIVVINLITEH